MRYVEIELVNNNEQIVMSFPLEMELPLRSTDSKQWAQIFMRYCSGEFGYDDINRYRTKAYLNNGPDKMKRVTKLRDLFIEELDETWK